MTKTELWEIFHDVSEAREMLLPGDVSRMGKDGQQLNRAFMKLQDTVFTMACNAKDVA